MPSERDKAKQGRSRWSNSDDVLDFFHRHLRQKREQSNRDQALIIGFVLSAQGPFTVDHIIRLLSGVADVFNVDRETVQSILEQLTECGLVERQSMGDGADGYAKCVSRIKEIEAPKPPMFRGRFSDLCSAFHDSHIAGICPWCGGHSTF